MLKSTNSNYKYTFEARTVQLDNNLSLRLNKLNPSIPDLFFKCNHFQGTFFHCVWECGELQKFWRKVTHYVSQFTTPISLSPVMCIGGLCGQLLSARQRKERKKKNGWICGYLQASNSIALCWKNTSFPSLGWKTQYPVWPLRSLYLWNWQMVLSIATYNPFQGTLAFPGNQTHDLSIVSANCLSYRKAKGKSSKLN